jgi:hypothetical protein
MTDATGKWEDHHGRTQLQLGGISLIDDTGAPMAEPVESDLQIELSVGSATRR